MHDDAQGDSITRFCKNCFRFVNAVNLLEKDLLFN